MQDYSKIFKKWLKKVVKKFQRLLDQTDLSKQLLTAIHSTNYSILLKIDNSRAVPVSNYSPIKDKNKC